jgi:hypothetical protein
MLPKLEGFRRTLPKPGAWPILELGLGDKTQEERKVGRNRDKVRSDGMEPSLGGSQ